MDLRGVEIDPLRASIGNFESGSFFEETKSPRDSAPVRNQGLSNLQSLPDHDLQSAAESSPARSQASNKTTDLEKLFKCFICFSELNEPVMCPSCSKFACGNCLKKWLTETRQ